MGVLELLWTGIIYPIGLRKSFGALLGASFFV